MWSPVWRSDSKIRPLIVGIIRRCSIRINKYSSIWINHIKISSETVSLDCWLIYQTNKLPEFLKTFRVGKPWIGIYKTRCVLKWSFCRKLTFHLTFYFTSFINCLICVFICCSCFYFCNNLRSTIAWPLFYRNDKLRIYSFFNRKQFVN